MSRKLTRFEDPFPKRNKEIHPEPWDPQWNEPDDAYEAFRLYLNQTPPRYISKVHTSDGVKVNQFQAHLWLMDWDWIVRAGAYDAHMRRILENEKKAQIEFGIGKIAERQLKILQTALDVAEIEFEKLYAKVASTPESKVDAKTLVALLDKVVVLQRLIFGESTAKVEIAEDFDYSKLDIEELRTIHETLIKVRK